MDFNRKVVLIVGASSGMGRGVALKLAGRGALLAVTARRKDRLDSLVREITENGGTCVAFVADAEDEEAAASVVQQVVERYGRIDLCLLNAGGAPALDMRKMDAAAVKSYMRSNYDVVVNYLFPVLRKMMEQRSGIVAHTNSLAGFLGVPLQGPYSAAKGAARLLIDTCRIEFASYGIKFISIYPGFVATEHTSNDGMPAPLEISEDRGVEYILEALQKEPMDFLFPPSMSRRTRLAAILPKSVTNWILQRTIPLPTD